MHRIKQFLVFVIAMMSLVGPCFAQDRSATGNIATTADNVSVSTIGMSALTVYVTGTFSATLTPQLSMSY